MSHNTWIHRGVRPSVRLLARTTITPNHVTTLRLVTGIAAALAVSAGSGIWLHVGAFGVWAMPMGMAAGLSVVLIQWQVMHIEERTGKHTAQLPSFAGFDADDAILVVPLAIWVGGAEPLLATAAIIAPIFAIFLFSSSALQQLGKMALSAAGISDFLGR